MGMPKLQVIGGGKMGEALLAGLLTGGWATAGQPRPPSTTPSASSGMRPSSHHLFD